MTVAGADAVHGRGVHGRRGPDEGAEALLSVESEGKTNQGQQICCIFRCCFQSNSQDDGSSARASNPNPRAGCQAPQPEPETEPETDKQVYRMRMPEPEPEPEAFGGAE